MQTQATRKYPQNICSGVDLVDLGGNVNSVSQKSLTASHFNSSFLIQSFLENSYLYNLKNGIG